MKKSALSGPLKEVEGLGMRTETKDYSDRGLRSMHEGIRTALADDDATPRSKPKRFGVRDTPDWRRWADALEAELSSRGLTFSQINWS